MAYQRDITADDKVFYDTDQLLRYAVYEGDPTAAEITAATAVPQNVAGWTFTWMLRKKAKTADPALIAKASGSGISITGAYNVDPTLNTQRVAVQIEDTDTYDPPTTIIAPGAYEYALKRADAGSETILAWGKFTLLQAAAWETP